MPRGALAGPEPPQPPAGTHARARARTPARTASAVAGQRRGITAGDSRVGSRSPRGPSASCGELGAGASTQAALVGGPPWPYGATSHLPLLPPRLTVLRLQSSSRSRPELRTKGGVEEPDPGLEGPDSFLPHFCWHPRACHSPLLPTSPLPSGFLMMPPMMLPNNELHWPHPAELCAQGLLLAGVRACGD